MPVRKKIAHNSASVNASDPFANNFSLGRSSAGQSLIVFISKNPYRENLSIEEFI